MFIHIFFDRIFKGTRHLPSVTSVRVFPLLLPGGNLNDWRTGAETNRRQTSSPVRHRRLLAEAARLHCHLSNKHLEKEFRNYQKPLYFMLVFFFLVFSEV